MYCTVARHEASKQRLLRHVNETTTGDIAIKSNKKSRISYKNSNTAAVNGFCIAPRKLQLFRRNKTGEVFITTSLWIDECEVFSNTQ